MSSDCGSGGSGSIRDANVLGVPQGAGSGSGGAGSGNPGPGNAGPGNAGPGNSGPGNPGPRSSGGPSARPLSSGDLPQRKRNRIRLSCTMCRDKKLKCNRKLPCDQCDKRGLAATCRFVPYLYARGESRSSQGPSQSQGQGPAQTQASQLAAGPYSYITAGPPVDPQLHAHTQQLLLPPYPRQHAQRHPSGAEGAAAITGHPSHHGDHIHHGDHDHHGYYDHGITHHPSMYADPTTTRGALVAHAHDVAAGTTAAERLNYLEHLVAVLRTQVEEATRDAPPSTPDASDASAAPVAQPAAVDVADSVGNILRDSRYIDSANWEGVLEDVVKLTENLVVVDHDDDDDNATTDEPDHWDLGPPTNGLALLSGGFSRVSIGDVFRHLPPRHIMDQLLERFFQGKEPAWMMFHRPSFARLYDQFWHDPRSASYSYLALLFMMVAHASLFCLRGDETVPGGLGDALDVVDACRYRAAHCLALDDYTRPGRHKVETMALYFGTEYLRQADAPLGTTMVLSITLRLAMHMGYHRDPTHFPHLTPFEGEMRRRTWAVLAEIDKLVSFEFGLPANARAEDSDTVMPRNLLDTDFDEDTEALPPSRPETERTPTLYTICKGRIMAVFGDIIVARTGTGTDKDYDHVLALDRRLRDAHDRLATPLRYVGPPADLHAPPPAGDGRLVTLTHDPVDLLMQRYLLELLYHKARLVLHRRFLGVARMRARFAYSRRVCVDSALRILRHQYDLYVAMLPGAPLAAERWFINSTSTHDFLLADMVLCLEVLYAHKEAQSGQVAATALEIDEPELLALLRTSRQIWETQMDVSAEAKRAYKILTQMLAGSTGNDANTAPLGRPTPAQPGDKGKSPASQGSQESQGSQASPSGIPPQTAPTTTTPPHTTTPMSTSSSLSGMMSLYDSSIGSAFSPGGASAAVFTTAIPTTRTSSTAASDSMAYPQPRTTVPPSQPQSQAYPTTLAGLPLLSSSSTAANTAVFSPDAWAASATSTTVHVPPTVVSIPIPPPSIPSQVLSDAPPPVTACVLSPHNNLTAWSVPPEPFTPAMRLDMPATMTEPLDPATSAMAETTYFPDWIQRANADSMALVWDKFFATGDHGDGGGGADALHQEPR